MISLVASSSKKMHGITAIPRHMDSITGDALDPHTQAWALSADQLAQGLCHLVPQQGSLEGFLAC